MKEIKHSKQYKKDLLNNNKQCVICDIVKPLSNFSLYKPMKNTIGLHSRCNSCIQNNKEIPTQLEIDTRRGYKQCNKCEQTFNITEFDKDNRFNVYLTYCKGCIKKKTNKNRNKRKKTNPSYRLRTSINYRIKRVLNGIRKSDKCMNLLGLSLIEFEAYLESKFQPGMTWENKGFGDCKWHIDHILPSSLFDMRDERQQRICFHYTNLQPMWQQNNISKNDKLPDGRRCQDMSDKEKLDYLISLGFNL